MPSNRLPLHVVHYSDKDPREHVGGVETFARTLREIFEQVTFMTPGSSDVAFVAEKRIPVICDNHRVMDWPEAVPVIGFQHGVAAVKFTVTRSYHHWKVARAQKKAAGRPNTLWVADAEWVSQTFAKLYGNGASHVVYHPIDVEHFDGILDNRDSNLILHDARTRHKGKTEIAEVARAFPKWSFERLNCPLGQVPNRMRKAKAFIHLSKYEGYGIVCSEAMAMNLPCLFTRVGLMLDDDRPDDVAVIEPEHAFGNKQTLLAEVRRFLESLDERTYNPRKWILEHSTFDHARASWRSVMETFQERSGWRFNL